jgi:hypothetical protein
LELDAYDRAAGYARDQAKADSAHAGAEIEHPVAGSGLDGSSQQHGVDSHAVASPGL